MTIDELDARLIATLRENPRVGLLEVARQLGVARGTVQARLAKLEARGVITGHGPEVDPRGDGLPDRGVRASSSSSQGRLDEATAALDGDPRGARGRRDQRPAGPALPRSSRATPSTCRSSSTELLAAPAIRRCTSYIVLSRQVPPRTGPLVAAAGGADPAA